MKVTGLETIRLAEFPAILFLQVHTDEGLIGLGENCVGVESVETFLHESVAPRLLGKNPLNINEIHEVLHQDFIGFNGSSIAVRATSSIDIALWDLFGQVTGQPIYQLLGGKVRDKIRAYNTCAGSAYAKGSSNIDRNRKAQLGTVTDHEYEDLFAFLNNPEDLVASLKAMGMTAMKIWPFDVAAEKSHGQYISPQDLNSALEPFRKIRNAVGDKMDIMVEFHSLWRLPMAQKISRALQEFDTFWHEDAIRMDSLDLLKQYAVDCKALICASETLSYKWGFKDYLQTGVAGVAMLDLSWCGGLTEARKIAAMADAWQLPVAPHDCTGPVVWTASTHLSLHAPNALIQESVRAFYSGWYKELVTELPQVKNGMISLNDKPGLGLELLPDLHQRADAVVRVSR